LAISLIELRTQFGRLDSVHCMIGLERILAYAVSFFITIDRMYSFINKSAGNCMSYKWR